MLSIAIRGKRTPKEPRENQCPETTRPERGGFQCENNITDEAEGTCWVHTQKAKARRAKENQERRARARSDSWHRGVKGLPTCVLRAELERRDAIRGPVEAFFPLADPYWWRRMKAGELKGGEWLKHGDAVFQVVTAEAKDGDIVFVLNNGHKVWCTPNEEVVTLQEKRP